MTSINITGEIFHDSTDDDISSISSIKKDQPMRKSGMMTLKEVSKSFTDGIRPKFSLLKKQPSNRTLNSTSMASTTSTGSSTQTLSSDSLCIHADANLEQGNKLLALGGKKNHLKAFECFQKSLHALEFLHGLNDPIVAMVHEKIAHVLLLMGDENGCLYHLDMASSIREEKEENQDVEITPFTPSEQQVQRLDVRLRELPPLDFVMSDDEDDSEYDNDVFIPPRKIILGRPRRDNCITDDVISLSSHSQPQLWNENDKKLADTTPSICSYAKSPSPSYNVFFSSHSQPQLWNENDKKLADTTPSICSYTESPSPSYNGFSGSESDEDEISISDDDFKRGLSELSASNAKDARRYFESFYERYVNSLGSSHPKLVLTREKIGDCALALDRLGEAQIHYEATLREYRRDQNDEIVARVLVKCGKLHMSSRKWRFASYCFDEAWGLRKNRYGVDHGRTVRSLKGLVKVNEEMMLESTCVEQKRKCFETLNRLLEPYVQEDEKCDNHWKERGLFQLCFLRVSKMMGNYYYEKNFYKAAFDIYEAALVTYETKRYYGGTYECCRFLADISHNIGVICEQKCDFEKALNYYKKELELRDGIKHDATEVVASILHIGRLYMRFDCKKQNENAIPMLDDAFRIIKRSSKSMCNDAMLSNLDTLATLYGKQNRMLSALQCLEEKIDRITNLDLDSHYKLSITESYHRIACIHYHMGNYAKAIYFHERVHHIQLSSGIFSNEHMAKTLRYLGSCYIALDDYDNALGCYLDFLERSNVNEDNVATLIQIGGIYNKQGNTKKAIQHLQQVLKNPSILSDLKMRCKVLNRLGYAYAIVCDSENAMSCFKEAHSICQNTETFCGLGYLHWQYQSYQAAEKCFMSSMKLLPSNSDENSAAIVMNNMGNVTYRFQSYEKAMHYYEQSLQYKVKCFGTQSVHLLGVLTNLGTVYVQMKQHATAIDCFQRALSILSTQYNQKRDEVKDFNNDMIGALVHHKLGNTYLAVNDLDNANNHYKVSLQMKRRVVGTFDHVTVLLTLHNMALVMCKKGQYVQARNILENIYNNVSISEKIKGGPYPEIGKLGLDLSSVSLAMGEYEDARRFYDEAMEHFRSKEKASNHHRLLAQSISKRLVLVLGKQISSSVQFFW